MWPGTPQCQRLIDGEQCGLDHGHDGQHLPYTPGDYLPPPILHPLFLLGWGPWPWRLRCPLCGERVDCTRLEEVTAFRHFEDGQWGAPEIEGEWTFEPCGHVAREIITHAAPG